MGGKGRECGWGRGEGVYENLWRETYPSGTLTRVYCLFEQIHFRKSLAGDSRTIFIKRRGGETFKKGVFQGQFSYRRSSKEGFSLSNLFEEGGMRRGDRSKKRVVLVIILIFFKRNSLHLLTN